jgi:Carboxypeptidase regulatory-like domain
MFQRDRRSIFFVVSFAWMALAFAPCANAQQTLGGITGTVTDPSGSALPNTTVTLVGDQTALTRTEKTDATGVYTFVNLPIGTYTLTFTHDAFQTQKIPSIMVQANRTATVYAVLKVGEVSTTLTVQETPLVNAVDTTNGYVLDTAQIQDVPLPTGSFTGLAILSPGVNAELPSGNGVNAGLGNAPIWANGQRDTSNTFLLNGVDAKNLFNGKSTSEVSSARVVNNTGVSGAASTSAFEIQSTASPYLAIGQALPSPPPETIQEVRVNTSMYDAQQGSTSGAHIDLSTASGTNDIHGQGYLHHATDWLNAAPFFFNQDPHITQKVPELHRETPGGTLGGPIIKKRLFGFISYQHVHDSDQEIGLGRATVPVEFTAAGGDPTKGYAPCGADRATASLEACLVGIVNNDFGGSITSANIDPIAFALLQDKLPNGQYLIPFADGIAPSFNFPENAVIPGTAYFLANQAVANVDFIATSKDTLALKYYYQRDPTIAPYAYSSVAGFTQHLDAGSQVATITNTQTLTPAFSVAEVFGFIREKVYSTVAQPPGFTPADLGINAFGSTTFPGITITDALGASSADNTVGPPVALQFGEGAASQGAFTGVFQNRFMPSVNAIWVKGRHTLTFGGTWSYTQLNTRDDRTNKGTIGFADFSQFVEGLVTPYTSDGFIDSTFLQGDANRYYRANETGEYVQDKFQLRPNLSLTLGLRWDYDGGLSEKSGKIYNFDPALYSFNDSTGEINLDASGNPENGFIVAGNNSQFPTKGVSNSTLTGRQWGLAPRLGLAWSPKTFNNKLVIRGGWGIYYDRGELFTYLSPGFAAGVIAGGPFGVNQSPPYVNVQSCTDISSFYLGFVPTCNTATASNPYSTSTPFGGSFENPWGGTLGPGPSGNPALLNLPDEAAIDNDAQLFSFAVYNRKNKLPYTLNQTLDIQWQPRNDLAVEVGYVGNLGRHEVIPVPFNQAQIATPTNPIHGQSYTYGYNILAPPGCNPTTNPGACAYTPTCNPSVTGGCGLMGLPDGSSMLATFEGGNVDLRVPFIGYSSESESYTAAGVSAYNALETHVEKRISHGVQVGFSYTYSHALDEQSALGLFYNGNNPLDLRSAYGNSDFDRTHVFNVSYLLRMHNFFSESSWEGKFADGWALAGVTIIQSGQPFSVIDFSGAVGSIFYGTSDGITNPIVPLAPGCTPKSALTGSIGAYGVPALKASCFTLPLLNPGDLGGAIPAGDTFETNFITSGQRNIFRQAWQKRADISFIKETRITERINTKFSFDVFNVSNTPSFDIPIDAVTQNNLFNDFPVIGASPYSPPAGLGNVNKTIGGPREIQMSLSVLF